MTEETITLMSLNDIAQANVIKTKLETQGIACFMNDKKGNATVKVSLRKKIDIKVYMKDLDKALSLIGDDLSEEKKE